jgi:uncharacterized secreted repeat protein (TIGR03808 family)
MNLSRRALIAGLAGTVLAPLAARAQFLDALALGLNPDSSEDQTGALQFALDSASASGAVLALPGGAFRTGTLRLAPNSAIVGTPGATSLVATQGVVFRGERLSAISLLNLTLDGGGIELEACGGTIENCNIRNADTAIFSRDAANLRIHGNTVQGCSNGGILVWRNEAGHDGTLVTGNRISGVDSHGGGNGQNGNGINIFRAGGVIVADNVIDDCAFSAVRINSGVDTIVRGNLCRNSSEVAIYSEFGFEGSIISDNIIDSASGGISMTNFNEGGRLAVCSGNIVRNIIASSPTNPDARPFGIFAEADAAITGNLVENVPGTGIGAGWGPYLRDVSIASNTVRNAMIGIAVSVVEGAGAANVTGNLISGAGVAAIAGTAWDGIVESDLVANAGRYPQLGVSGNMVS